jgi:proteasome lid subunit RPN8/RPN11
MIQHARQELPAECCGLLAGRVERTDAWASLYVPLLNAATEPTRRYQADIRSLLQAHRRIREAGWYEVAVVHSHPTSPPVPSRVDLAENAYGDAIIHLIISLARAIPEVRTWRLRENSFEEVNWQLAAV